MRKIKTESKKKREVERNEWYSKKKRLERNKNLKQKRKEKRVKG